MISHYLLERHRGVKDFEYKTPEWLDEMKTMLNNASLLASVISIISLVVGGLSTASHKFVPSFMELFI